MLKNVAVIGAGSWGTALSVLLCQKGHRVRLWSCFEEEIAMLNEKREHIRNLPGVGLPSGITCTSSLTEALEKHDITILVVPSHVVRQNARDIASYINPGDIVVSCAKGLEPDTGLRLSQVIREEIPKARIAALTGPSHAEEVARGIPTTVVSASIEADVSKVVQDVFMTPLFRVYTSTDITGAEIGGAIKNVIALAAGISDGLEYGDNTKAALMTRGITEIVRLGAAMGAQAQTFAGLSGIGDLIVTCTSMHSRNRRAGILIGRGESIREAINEVGMVVEGITASKAAYKLSQVYDVEMPIVTEMYQILFEGKGCHEAVADLMTRDRKNEMEDALWLA